MKFGRRRLRVQVVAEVMAEWRDAHLLCPALAVSAYPFCDLDADVALRRELQTQLAALLVEREMHHLDITQSAAPTASSRKPSAGRSLSVRVEGRSALAHAPEAKPPFDERIEHGLAGRAQTRRLKPADAETS